MNSFRSCNLIATAIIFLIISCSSGQEKNEAKLPRIAKTIPNNFIQKSEPDLIFRGDTVYHRGNLFSGFIYQSSERGPDTIFVGGYFNGVEEGRHAAWYSNGVMSEERFYINGKKEGLHRSWWPDGSPRVRFNCYNGELDGLLEEWSDSGLLIKQFNYRNGYEEGAQRLWWDNGTIRANYVVKNGRKYGLIGLKLCSNPYDSSISKK